MVSCYFWVWLYMFACTCVDVSVHFNTHMFFTLNTPRMYFGYIRNASFLWHKLCKDFCFLTEVIFLDFKYDLYVCNLLPEISTELPFKKNWYLKVGFVNFIHTLSKSKITEINSHQNFIFQNCWIDFIAHEQYILILICFPSIIYYCYNFSSEYSQRTYNIYRLYNIIKP